MRCRIESIYKKENVITILDAYLILNGVIRFCLSWKCMHTVGISTDRRIICRHFLKKSTWFFFEIHDLSIRIFDSRKLYRWVISFQRTMCITQSDHVILFFSWYWWFIFWNHHNSCRVNHEFIHQNLLSSSNSFTTPFLTIINIEYT